RRRLDSPLARRDGARAISACKRADDHGRLRRLKWSARAVVDSRAAKARRRDGPCDPRPSLSAGYFEVEQDRAPLVLPYHADLAWPTIDGQISRRRADRRDDDQDWPEGRVCAR